MGWIEIDFDMQVVVVFYWRLTTQQCKAIIIQQAISWLFSTPNTHIYISYKHDSSRNKSKNQVIKFCGIERISKEWMNYLMKTQRIESILELILEGDPKPNDQPIFTWNIGL